MLEPIKLKPEYREYVWGGKRIRPTAERTAEAWVVHEADRIAAGKFQGHTLGEAVSRYPEAILGKPALEKFGPRFPLLIKILDCADWLSLQVHPNDQQAVVLEGEGQYGKTEAWYFIEAEPEAEILSGIKPGVSAEELANAIRNGTLLKKTQRLKVKAGENILIPPGTIHALGPGMLVYEVQQSSDNTYRVYDWDRPASAGRVLHIEKSVAVSNVDQKVKLNPAGDPPDGGVKPLIACDYFHLTCFMADKQTISLDTKKETFAAITAVEGSLTVRGAGWEEELRRFEALVVPAECGAYTIRGRGKAKGLLATI